LCAQKQTSQHITRSQLDKKITASREHSPHAIVPAHRRRDLLLSGAPNFW
jgi:hypothetical protein